MKSFKKTPAWPVYQSSFFDFNSSFQFANRPFKRVEPQSTEMQKRTYLHFSQLKGMILSGEDKMHFSPINGAVFNVTGSLLAFYKLACKNKISATYQLMPLLFHLQDTQFRVINNKSFAAYSLNPTLLAKIMHHLNAGSLEQDEVRQPLITEWREHHRALTGDKLTTVKLNVLLDQIVASKKECLHKKYPEHATETILLAFLVRKATTRQELITYLQELKRLEPTLDMTMPSLHEAFDSKTIQAGQQLISRTTNIIDQHDSQLELHFFQHVKEKYEVILAALALSNSNLDQVLMSKYAYKNNQPALNCVEVCMHNFCNMMLFNKIQNKFDFSLLPSQLKPHADLLAFYAFQEFATHQVNTQAVGQHFMNMVSDRDELVYVRKERYELETNPANFLAFMNYFFGASVKNLHELSQAFSTEARQIIFKQDTQNSITVQFITEDGVERVRIDFFEQHASLESDFFTKNNHTTSLQYSKSLSQLAKKNISQFPELLPMILHATVDAKNDAIKRELLNNDSTDEMMTLDHFNYFTFYLPADCTMAALDYLDAVISHLGNHESFIHYLRSVINQFDNILLYAVSTGKKLALVNGLLEAGAKIDALDSFGRNLLFYADGQLLERLVNEGLDPNQSQDIYGQSPLAFACQQQKHANILLLLKKGAKPNAVGAMGLTPLALFLNSSLRLLISLSWHDQDDDVFVALLKAGANPHILVNVGGMSVCMLYLAISARMANKVVVALLEAGADPNQSIQGEPLLSRALFFVRDRGVEGLELIDLLLRKGANPNIADKNGVTPLIACLRMNTASDMSSNVLHFITALLRAGANPSTPDGLGNSPLHVAASCNDAAMLALLLEAGADPQAVNNYGFTPSKLTSFKALQKVLAEAQKPKQTALAFFNSTCKPNDAPELNNHPPTNFNKI